MEVSFMTSEDGDLETAYIKVRSGASYACEEVNGGEIVLDFDAQKNLLGIEVIDINHGTADLIRRLARDYGIPWLGRYMEKHSEAFA